MLDLAIEASSAIADYKEGDTASCPKPVVLLYHDRERRLSLERATASTPSPELRASRFVSARWAPVSL
jgi:hypothetical protein